MCEMFPRWTMLTAAAMGWVAASAERGWLLQPEMATRRQRDEMMARLDRHRQRRDAELCTLDLSRTGAGADSLSIAEAGDQAAHFLEAAFISSLCSVRQETVPVSGSLERIHHCVTGFRARRAFLDGKAAQTALELTGFR
jgi:hypothetical protein